MLEVEEASCQFHLLLGHCTGAAGECSAADGGASPSVPAGESTVVTVRHDMPLRLRPSRVSAMGCVHGAGGRGWRTRGCGWRTSTTTAHTRARASTASARPPLRPPRAPTAAPATATPPDSVTATPSPTPWARQAAHYHHHANILHRTCFCMLCQISVADMGAARQLSCAATCKTRQDRAIPLKAIIIVEIACPWTVLACTWTAWMGRA